MKAWAELGPIAGGIFAGIIGIAGAGQIALATAQYNQIQGWKKVYIQELQGNRTARRKFKVNSVGNMQTGVYSKPSVLGWGSWS